MCLWTTVVATRAGNSLAIGSQVGHGPRLDGRTQSFRHGSLEFAVVLDGELFGGGCQVSQGCRNGAFELVVTQNQFLHVLTGGQGLGDRSGKGIVLNLDQR